MFKQLKCDVETLQLAGQFSCVLGTQTFLTFVI